MIIPTDEEEAEGKTRKFDRTQVNFFIVAIFDDKTDLNVEMKAILFHYYIKVNPYTMASKPAKSFKSPYTGKMEYPIEFDTLTSEG